MFGLVLTDYRLRPFLSFHDAAKKTEGKVGGGIGRGGGMGVRKRKTAEVDISYVRVPCVPLPALNLSRCNNDSSSFVSLSLFNFIQYLYILKY